MLSHYRPHRFPFGKTLRGLCSLYTFPPSGNPHLPALHHRSRCSGAPFIVAVQEMYTRLYQDLLCVFELQICRPTLGHILAKRIGLDLGPVFSVSYLAGTTGKPEWMHWRQSWHRHRA